MDLIQAGVQWPYCLVYFDDINIISHDFDEHLQHFRDCFTEVEEAELYTPEAK